MADTANPLSRTAGAKQVGLAEVPFLCFCEVAAEGELESHAGSLPVGDSAIEDAMSTRITNEKLVKVIEDSTLEVFQTMLGIDPEVVNTSQVIEDPDPSDGIVSLIGMAGDWVGTGSFTCSARLACRISSTLLMTEYTAVNDDVLDAVAEITNITLGNVKTTLEEVLGPMGLSIPTVVYGRNFTTRSLGQSEWTKVRFRAGEDDFDIRLCLVSNVSLKISSRRFPVAALHH